MFFAVFVVTGLSIAEEPTTNAHLPGAEASPPVEMFSDGTWSFINDTDPLGLTERRGAITWEYVGQARFSANPEPVEFLKRAPPQEVAPFEMERPWRWNEAGDFEFIPDSCVLCTSWTCTTCAGVTSRAKERQ